MGVHSFMLLMAISLGVNALESETDQEDLRYLEDPKELFFSNLPLYPIEYNEDTELPIREKRRLDLENVELPQPGELMRNLKRRRDGRSVYYHVLPSPGLKSHFQPKSDEKSRNKRNAEQPFDLQFIQGTASNKDVISQNYAKSVVEEVTRTASIAGHLPGYELKFLQGTANTATVEGTTVPSVAVSPTTTRIETTPVAQTEKLQEKPLEIQILDKADLGHQNQTQPPLVISPPITPQENLTNDLSINDFIRFRRNTFHHSESANKQPEMEFIQPEARYIDNVPEESMVEERTIPLAVRLEEDRMRLKRDKIHRERSGKMLLATADQSLDTNREPRGATKEQWVKQPYPVQNPKLNRFDDNSGSSSEGIRAPRVHFVTQRRSESAPQPTYYYYDREGRSRDFNMDLSRENSRDMAREADRSRDYYYRSPKYYRPRAPYYSRYYEDDEPAEARYIRNRSPYEGNNRGYEPPRMPTYSSNANKQRRIIYYATLPEVVRGPASGEVRDRYNRGRYEDRLQRPAVDSYNYRKPYAPSSAGKSRYDETTRKTSSYPLKVSTDVSVSEIKKNPERKIYAEPERRYSYKSPGYRHESETYDRRH